MLGSTGECQWPLLRSVISKRVFSDKMKLLSVKVVVTYEGRRVCKLEVATYQPEEALGFS